MSKRAGYIGEQQLEVVAEQNEDARTWQSRAVGACVVAGAGAALIFEQSPANEILRINAGFSILDKTDSAPLVGAGVAGITAGIEFGSSALIAAGLHYEKGAVNWFKRRLQKSAPEEARAELGESIPENKGYLKKQLGKVANFGADVGIALGIGAGLVTIKRHIQDPDPTLSKDLKVSAKASALVASVSGGIAYLTAGGVTQAEKVGLGKPAEVLVDYGTNSVFWLGALAAGYGVFGANKLRKAWQARGEQDSLEIPQVSQEIEQDTRPNISLLPQQQKDAQT